MAETFEAYRTRILRYLGDKEPIGVQQATVPSIVAASAGSVLVHATMSAANKTIAFGGLGLILAMAASRISLISRLRSAVPSWATHRRYRGLSETCSFVIPTTEAELRRRLSMWSVNGLPVALRRT
jgi:hypothetical protein